MNMPSQKVKRKFHRRGRQASFARHAGVSRVTVCDWLRGRVTSARLDKLAREWNPNASPENIPNTGPINGSQQAA
jgi:hypothetical protein